MIRAAEKVAVLGRNWVGKSMLPQALPGILEPSVGELSASIVNSGRCFVL